MKGLYILAGLAGLASISFSQPSINTVAGTTWAFTPGPTAISTPLGIVRSTIVDSLGNVYGADTENHMVLRVSAGGVLTIIAGTGVAGFSGDGGAATNARLNNPVAVALDGLGNLYIADKGNQRVRVIAGGDIATLAGNGSAGFGGDGGPMANAVLNNPSGLAVDSSGRLYIADSGNARLRRISSGTITTVAGTGVAGGCPNGVPPLSCPMKPDAVAVDGSGNLYVATLQEVRKITASTVVTVAGSANIAGFFGDGGLAGGGNSLVNNPLGIVVDSSGNVYIADTDNQRIRKVDGSGMINTIAGNGVTGYSGDGGPAGAARLTSPSALALDGAGNLLIADAGNRRVRKVTGSSITTVAGNGGYKFQGDGGSAASASLYTPRGVVIDALGNLLIADTNNHRIRKVDASLGVVTTFAGTGEPGLAGDGGPAVNARLNQPRGLAFDSSGNLYVADSGNNRLRKISPDGTITAVAETLAAPLSLGVDASGGIPFTESVGTLVRQVAPDGTLTIIAGTVFGGVAGDGIPAPSAALTRPSRLALDAAGNLYISDTGGFRLRKVDPSGIISTVAGTGSNGSSGDGNPATTAALVPGSLALDLSGNRYVVDGQRVRVINAAGTINAFAGSVGSGFAGDGGAASLALLADPDGLAVDAAGNLYIADSSNDRVRKVGNNLVPVPAIASLTPSSVSAGSPPFLLTVNGSNFLPGSIVKWNGSFRVTSFVSSIQLQAAILATDIAATGIASVTVFNPAPGGGSSNALSVSLTPLPAGPLVVTAAATAVGYAQATLNGYVNPNGVTVNAWFEWSTTKTFSTFASTPVQSLGSGTLLLTPSAQITALQPQSTYFYRVAVANGPSTLRGVIVALTTTLPPPVLQIFAGGAGGGLQGGSPVISAPLGTLSGLSKNTTQDFYTVDTHRRQILKIAPSGTYTVVAGNGGNGYSGEGVVAIAATLETPSRVVADSSGNLFFMEPNRIRKVDTNGILTTYAGTGLPSGDSNYLGEGGPATNARVTPSSLWVDSSGNVFFSDFSVLRIRKVSPAGIVTTVAGNGSTGFPSNGSVALNTGLAGPDVLTGDNAGNLYFVDGLYYGNFLVRKLTAGIITTIAGVTTSCNDESGDGGSALAACIRFIRGMAVDANGNLFLSVSFSRIRKVTAGGIITTIAGSPTRGFTGDGGPAANALLNYPEALTFDASGSLLFVADNHLRKIDGNGIISTFAGSGSLTFGGDGGPATSALLNQPTGVALDPAGNLYVADRSNFVVRKITPLGIISTVAGNLLQGFSGDGGPALQASLDNPRYIATDNSGNVFFADYGNNRIRQISANGTITTVAGNGTAPAVTGIGGPATSAGIPFPKGIATNSAGNLLIATAHQVLRVSGGLLTVLAGNGNPGFSGEGSSAPLAMLFNPTSVAVDSAGNTLICDNVNQRIRKVNTAGTISTVAGSANQGSGGDGGPAILAQLNNPLWATPDANGNVYINDADNFRVRKVSPAGKISTILGGSAPVILQNDPGISHAESMAADRKGNLYLADPGANVIHKLVVIPGNGIVAAGSASGLPGGLARIPITLTLDPGFQLNSLSVGVFLSPNGAAPMLETTLSFQPASGFPAPGFTDAAADFIRLAWPSLANPISGTVSLGEVIVNVPNAAAPGQGYALRISGASGAFGATALNLLPDTSASLAVGGLYKVGDVFPRDADAVGQFGDSTLNVLDLIQVLFAVNNVPGFRPPTCSDRFDAMDLFPVDAGGTRGGDGLLDIRDLVRELFRVNNIDLDRPQRVTRGLVCSGVLERPRVSGDGEGQLVLGDPEAAGVPVYLEAQRGLARVALTVALGDGQSQLRFVPAGIAPTLAIDNQPGVLALAWLEGITVKAGERLLLGHVAGSANLTAYGLSASTLDDNREVRLDPPNSRKQVQ